MAVCRLRRVATGCPQCGCIKESGLRVAACGDPDCCCQQIATRTGLERIAAELLAAFEARDMEAFGALLADDARWGGDTIPNRCRNRLLNAGLQLLKCL